MSFFSEIRRRNVLRVAALYVVASWLVMQVADVVISLLELPSGTGRLIFIVLAIGLPVALVFSWFFELTPEGVKLEKDVDRTQSITAQTGRRLTIFSSVLLGLAVISVGLNQLVERQGAGRDVLETGAEATESGDVATQTPPENSVAVLPFLDRTGTGTQGYLAEGIAEDILNFLAQVPEMHVIARTSSFAFRQDEADVATIARALNVGHVLEGSVRFGQENVRVTAQLIQANTGYQLWSEHYDRRLRDIHQVQTEVAAAVVNALEVAMLEPPPPATVDPEAYRLLLEARSESRPGTKDGWLRAQGLLEKALTIDPDYVDAIVEVGWTQAEMARNMVVAQKPGFSAARNTFHQALALKPDAAGARRGVAWVDLMEGDYAAAAAGLREALAVDPQNLDTLTTAAVLLKYLGRYRQAADVERYVAGRDPISATSHNNLGLTLMTLGRYAEAERHFRKVIGFRPEDPWARLSCGFSLLLQDEPEAALREFDLADDQSRALGRAMAMYALGREGDSLNALEDLKALAAENEPSAVAFAHAYRNEINQAFEWFDKEYELSGNGAWYAEWKADPLLRNLHDDPRWDAMLHRVGLSPSQVDLIDFEVIPPSRLGRNYQALLGLSLGSGKL